MNKLRSHLISGIPKKKVFLSPLLNGCNKIYMQDLHLFSHVGAWLHYITSDNVCNQDKNPNALKPYGGAPNLELGGRGWWNLNRKTLKERNLWNKSWKMLGFSQVRGTWWKTFRIVVIAIIQFSGWLYARHCAQPLGCNIHWTRREDLHGV